MRRKENRPLPKNWRRRGNTYMFRVPRHLREQFGKTEIGLGTDLSEAYRKYADLVSLTTNVFSVRDLLDRYQAEVVPKKAKATQRSNMMSIARLRAAFHDNKAAAIQPVHIYQYRDFISRKHSEKIANLDLEVLSHAFTKAIEWGVRPDHPMTAKKVVKFRTKARKRYVEDWELEAWRAVASPMLRAFANIVGCTGLRKSDVLNLRRSDWTEQGLLVTTGKTGKKMLYVHSPDLAAAVEAAKASSGKVKALTMFCTRKGQGYVKEDGSTSGFDSIWQRAMKKAIAETALEEPFTAHDLRAKFASDFETDSQASDALGHTSVAVTRKHYRRGASVVESKNRFIR